jgi:hypothetical protein
VPATAADSWHMRTWHTELGLHVEPSCAPTPLFRIEGRHMRAWALHTAPWNELADVER